VPGWSLSDVGVAHIRHSTHPDPGRRRMYREDVLNAALLSHRAGCRAIGTEGTER